MLLDALVVSLAITNGTVNNVPLIAIDDAPCVRIEPVPVLVPLLVKLTPFKVSVLPPTANVPPPLMTKLVVVTLPLPKVTLPVKVVIEGFRMLMPLMNVPEPDKLVVPPKRSEPTEIEPLLVTFAPLALTNEVVPVIKPPLLTIKSPLTVTV